MSKAKAIVELVTYQALAATVTGAGVYQDAPADVSGRLVVIGDLKSFRLPTKGGKDDRRVLVSIITIAEGEERAPLLELQEQVEAALDGESFEHDGWTIAFEFEDDDAALTEDGITYAGVTQFSVLALSPDP